MNHLSKQFSPFIPQVPYLTMLVLFGSRGREEAHENSDWDFAVLYDEDLAKEQLKGWDWLKIYDILADAFEISSDAIDVVNLNQCSPLIAHYIARDGQLIYEQETGLFEQFKRENLMSQEELKFLRQVMRREIEEFLQNA
jgi:predicted nucleotidyltransferase